MRKIKLIASIIGVFLAFFVLKNVKVYASDENKTFSNDEMREICVRLYNEIGPINYIAELIDDFTAIKNKSIDFDERVKCDGIIAYLRLMQDWDDSWINNDNKMQKIIVKLACEYFKFKNCEMAAELLLESYRLANGDDHLEADEKYIVLNNHRLMHTSLYDDVSASDSNKGNILFDKNGNIYDEDCYYALRNAEYEKDASNLHIVNIYDKYDFEWTKNAPTLIDALCNLFYYLTKINVIKTYKLVVYGEIPHYFDNLLYDSNYHYYQCGCCEEKSNYQYHNFRYSQYDFEYHNKYCITCGYSSKERHNWVKYNIKNGEFETQYIPGYKCRNCGLIKEGELF